MNCNSVGTAELPISTMPSLSLCMNSQCNANENLFESPESLFEASVSPGSEWDFSDSSYISVFFKFFVRAHIFTCSIAIQFWHQLLVWIETRFCQCQWIETQLWSITYDFWLDQSQIQPSSCKVIAYVNHIFH